MKTISRISTLTIASLHGGLFRFLFNVNSNFSKEAVVRGKGSASGALQHLLLGGLHFQMGDVYSRVLPFPQTKYAGDPTGGGAR